MLIIMLGCVFNTWAYDFMVDGIYYTVDNETQEATVVRKDQQTTYSGDIVIPETVTHEGSTYTVTAIGESAFSRSNIQSLSLPNTLRTIMNSAFYLCNGLTEVVVPNSVTSIGKYAFSDDKDLTRIFIGSGVESIGEYLIEDDYLITSLEVHPDNAYYDSREDCNAIIETATNTLIAGCKNTVIPNTVTEIGHEAFYRTSGPEHVIIPNSVTKIGTIAFYYTQGLKHITVGSGVVDIVHNPFSHMPDSEIIEVDPSNPKYDSRDNCNAIIETATNTLVSACRNTVIPNTVTNIGQWSYQGLVGMDEVIIPSSVTNISHVAFASSEIKRITIPGTVKTIENGAFDMCLYLEEVYIEDGLTSLGREAFRLCPNLKHCRLPNTITALPYGLFWQCDNLQELIIPNSVIEVGDYAAYSCTETTRLVIGSSVKSIGVYAFRTLSKLPAVTCLAPTPPDVYETSFSALWKNTTILRVPESSVELYKTRYPWNQAFLDIVGVCEDGSAGPGDTDGDGNITIADVTLLIDAMLSGDTSALFINNADLNNNGRIDVGDITSIIDMLSNLNN